MLEFVPLSSETQSYIQSRLSVFALRADPRAKAYYLQSYRQLCFSKAEDKQECIIRTKERLLGVLVKQLRRLFELSSEESAIIELLVNLRGNKLAAATAQNERAVKKNLRADEDEAAKKEHAARTLYGYGSYELGGSHEDAMDKKEDAEVLCNLYGDHEKFDEYEQDNPVPISTPSPMKVERVAKRLPVQEVPVSSSPQPREAMKVEPMQKKEDPAKWIKNAAEQLQESQQQWQEQKALMAAYQKSLDDLLEQREKEKQEVRKKNRWF
jgi:hypothetical protein